MTTVNLGVVCKLIFAFLPENIGVSVGKVSVVARCPFLFIEAFSIKSSSVVNGPAPHEYGPGSLKNEIQVNAIR